jgi:hypothetical protein
MPVVETVARRHVWDGDKDNGTRGRRCVNCGLIRSGRGYRRFNAPWVAVQARAGPCKPKEVADRAE